MIHIILFVVIRFAFIVPAEVILPVVASVEELILVAFIIVDFIDGVLIFTFTFKLSVVIFADVKLVDVILGDDIKFLIFKFVPFIVIAIIDGVSIIPLTLIFALVVILVQLISPLQIIEPELLILVVVNSIIFAVDVIKSVEVIEDVNKDNELISFVIFKDNPEIKEDAFKIPVSIIPSLITFKYEQDIFFAVIKFDDIKF